MPVSILKTLIGLVLLSRPHGCSFEKRIRRTLFKCRDQPRSAPAQPSASFRADRNGRRNISHADAIVLPLGAHSQAAAVSALFILVNSISGLAGYFTSNHYIPALGIIVAPTAVIGGILGSHFGSRRFPVRLISLLLATVLVIAGSKLIFTK